MLNEYTNMLCIPTSFPRNSFLSN